jgi:hypothetical protein
MSAFTVDVANSPGQLARLCDVLAARGVNLVVCGLAHGGGGTIAFIADDEPAARGALHAAEIEYVERPALTVRLEMVPGAAAGAFRKLAEANVNLDVFLPIRIFDDQFYAVICPDDLDAATDALGEQVVSG